MKTRAPSIIKLTSGLILLVLVSGCGDQTPTEPPASDAVNSYSLLSERNRKTTTTSSSSDTEAESDSSPTSVLDPVQSTSSGRLATEEDVDPLQETADILHALFSRPSTDDVPQAEALQEAKDIVQLAAARLNEYSAAHPNEKGTFTTVRYHLNAISAALEKQASEDDADGAAKTLDQLGAMMQMYLPPAEE